MSATAALVSRDDLELVRRGASGYPTGENASTLQTIATKCDRIADLVEDRWSEVPDEVKQALIAIAYQASEPATLSVLQRFGFWKSRVRFAYLVLANPTRDVIDFARASQRLKHAVLSAVESEHEEYQRDLEEALRSFDSSKTREVTDSYHDDLVQSVLG